jgi:hypothetical protein
MEIKHPNRHSGQSTGTEEFRRKQSGDQHIEPPDEADGVPSQPHRMNRTPTRSEKPADRPPDAPEVPEVPEAADGNNDGNDET